MLDLVFDLGHDSPHRRCARWHIAVRRDPGPAVVLDILGQGPRLLQRDSVPELRGDRDVVARAGGEIQAEAIGPDFDLRARDDPHAREAVGDLVGDDEGELVVGLREADEAGRDVEVIAARAVGQHQIADFDERLVVTGEQGRDLESFEIEVPTALLSGPRLYFRGSVTGASPLRIEPGLDGVQIANPGPSPSAAGFLLAERGIFRLPELAPGETWSAEPVKPVSRSVLPGWLTTRLARTPAVVVRHVPDALRQIRVAGAWRGWTLISLGSQR